MVTTKEVSLPRDCTFSPTDWQALAPFWYPVAFSHEVTATKPYGARLLDERLVIYRVADGSLVVAKDLCLHRGAPLSLGWVEGDRLVCPYHGVQYDRQGKCVCIPAQPEATIPARLKLKTFPVIERYGLVWTRLIDNGEVHLPEMSEWDDPDYLQVLPNAVELNAAAGRQVEGFLDVSHFAFIHAKSFGEQDNPEVPDYAIEQTANGFRADYISTVSNYAHGMKHLAPPDFLWRRLFELYLPFTAKLTVFFPHGKLHVMNAASPISARKTRVFVPICRNFDKDAPLQDTLDFNHQVFAEDKDIVEEQWPEDLPMNLADEVHIAGDKSSITFRKRLAALGLGRSYTA
ncbi:aromatic ring-hydroxylating dioxygenase subunit alpha [Pseudanabaena cinerea]|jgi:vanillate O-demethylase monooxygenase subunit|nr:aromatic ring-hydroxylating dioxygenase subunit alpha [Pseudanabaena cinerea]